MASLFVQLTDLLTEQLNNYDELIRLSQAKKDVIIANDAESLTSITSDENTLVGRVQKLDKTRVSLMEEIGAVVGISEKDFTLSALYSVLKEQGAENHEYLYEIIGKTRDKLDTLKALNDQNKDLVESSLDYIDFSVNAIRSGRESDKLFYNASGEEIARTASFFDAWQ